MDGRVSHYSCEKDSALKSSGLLNPIYLLHIAQTPGRIFSKIRVGI